MKRSAGRWVIRLLLGAGFALMLTGPAPGNVGGCGAPPPFVDPATFCDEFERLSCWRDAAAGRVTEPEFQACLGRVSTVCIGFAFTCAPLRSSADECLYYITDERGLSFTTERLLAEPGNACDLCP